METDRFSGNDVNDSTKFFLLFAALAQKRIFCGAYSKKARAYARKPTKGVTTTSTTSVQSGSDAHTTQTANSSTTSTTSEEHQRDGTSVAQGRRESARDNQGGTRRTWKKGMLSETSDDEEFEAEEDSGAATIPAKMTLNKARMTSNEQRIRCSLPWEAQNT